VAIQRVERVVYGVTDLDACARFFDDFGLERRDTGGAGLTFATLVNQQVELRSADDAELPPPIEDGPTLREVVWGVESTEALERLAEELSTDREVSRGLDGAVHTRDETGFGIGFMVTDPVDVEVVPPAVNSHHSVGRLNRPLDPPGRVRPLRICHVALNIPKEGRDDAVDFYADRLGFRITDRVLPMGTFMQCEGDADQHNLMLCHRPDRASVNHTAYEVPTFEDVIIAGNYMVEHGWEEARRLGRHTVGSNVFRFVHAPCGGRVEYAADMDRVDECYGTRVHETSPPHHLWTLRGRLDGDA
jgi:catechol 2,3-dioxygenase-like lactoylglutathione lyase family enzyme